MLDFLNVNSFNKKLLEEKELIQNEQLSEEFKNAYSMYYYMLLKYVDRVLNLRSVDSRLKRLKEPIKPNKNKENSQNLSYMKYIYIENCLHIELFDKNTIKVLSNMYANKQLEFTKDLIDFVKKSYKAVISNDGDSSLKIYISYDFEMKKNDYNSYDDIINNTTSSVNLERKKINTNIKDYIDVPIIFENKGYNEESITMLKKAFKK